MRWVRELMRSCSPASTAWQESQRTRAHTYGAAPRRTHHRDVGRTVRSRAESAAGCPRRTHTAPPAPRAVAAGALSRRRSRALPADLHGKRGG
eukprot:2837886-Pyramimonas_sp.AAC.1